MTVYSIRTDIGRELWWTTNRKRAVELAAQMTEVGRWITPPGVVGGFNAEHGLRAFDLPVAVYKCSAVKAASLPVGV